MTINDEIALIEQTISHIHHMEARLKAMRMELTAVKDSRIHQRDMLVRHVVEDILGQPTPDDVAEATEWLYGDGMTAAEAYLQHIQDSLDNFDIEEGADLS